MKKLINAVDAVVREQLMGMAAAHPELKVRIEPHYITRADSPVMGKVALVSGGGSGHEPMHGGLVGKGMLDGACPGEIFTSPTPDQMYECGQAVDGGAGVQSQLVDDGESLLNAWHFVSPGSGDEPAPSCYAPGNWPPTVP